MSRMQQVGAVLERVPVAHRAAEAGVRAVGRSMRHAQIRRYLEAVPAGMRLLKVGAGAQADEGWLSTDLVPVARGIVQLDAGSRWPLPAGTFRAIQAEHVIEHLPPGRATRLMSEAARALDTDGVLRISTPNLDTFRRLPDLLAAELAQPGDGCGPVEAYVRWSNATFGTAWERAWPLDACAVVNRMMRSWGHQRLYSAAELGRLLRLAGFARVVVCEPGESTIPELKGVDRHAELIGDDANRIESLIVEAVR